MINYLKRIKKLIPSTIEFTIPSFKSFWISFIAVFILVILQHLGVKKEVDIFVSNIFPKIENKINTYRLKKKTSFVRQSLAASFYDNARSYTLIDYDTGDIIL